jgi:ammonia channel protein AmtB
MAYSVFVKLNGVLYVLIALITVPTYILVILSIIRTGSIKKSITLRILLSLAHANIVQLIIHGIAGFSIIIGVELNDTVNDVMGFIMGFLWWVLQDKKKLELRPVTSFQHFALALNRLKTIMSKTIVQEGDFRYCDVSCTF